MSFFIACLLIYGFGMSPWLYVVAFMIPFSVWLLHLNTRT